MLRPATLDGCRLTLRASLRQICEKKLSPPAFSMLRLCLCLDIRKIPLALLEEAFIGIGILTCEDICSNKASKSSLANQDPVNIRRAIGAVRELLMLFRKPDGTRDVFVFQCRMRELRLCFLTSYNPLEREYTLEPILKHFLQSESRLLHGDVLIAAAVAARHVLLRKPFDIYTPGTCHADGTLPLQLRLGRMNNGQEL